MSFPSSACEISAVQSFFSFHLVPIEWQKFITEMCRLGFPPEFIAILIHRNVSWPQHEKSIKDAFPEHSFSLKELDEIKEIYFKHGDNVKFTTAIGTVLDRSAKATASTEESFKQMELRLNEWDSLLIAVNRTLGQLSDVEREEVYLNFVIGLWTEEQVFNHLKNKRATVSKLGI